MASSAPKRDASDVYDRQIRLWGADAQSKISKANILYVNITGVSSEILKNMVLAGVKATICDGRKYTDAMTETPSSFFPREINTQAGGEEEGKDSPKRKKQRLEEEGVGSVAKAIKPYVEELNPLLGDCEIDDRELSDIPSEYFKKFDIVVASKVPLKEALRISKVSQKFILVDCFGWNGCAILDHGPNHEFRKEKGKDKYSDPEKVENYLSFEDIINVKLGELLASRWHKKCPEIYADYRAILQYEEMTGNRPDKTVKKDFTEKVKTWFQENHAFEFGESTSNSLETVACLAKAEVSPVCAILGGVLGNEIVKSLSGKGEPANNVLLFNGMDGGCQNYLVKKKN